jgi:hypothetical protein
MEARVLKPFTTPLHRFQVGQLIADTDLDGPMDMVQLIEAGFVVPGSAELPPEQEPMSEHEGSSGAEAVVETSDEQAEQPKT